MADVTSFTAVFKGTRTMTAVLTLGGTLNETVSNAQLLGAAPSSGVLFTFLNTVYATDTDVATAFSATNAGVLDIQPVTGQTSYAWLWKANNAKPSVQLVNTAAAGVANVTLQFVHSIAQ
jgi:hypothetical protein